MSSNTENFRLGFTVYPSQNGVIAAGRKKKKKRRVYKKKLVSLFLKKLKIHQFFNFIYIIQYGVTKTRIVSFYKR